jgi:replication fork protection complex subunit Tof1/Swi1
VIPYLSDEQADAATKNPHLKLLFRLAKFFILDEGQLPPRLCVLTYYE